MKIFGYCRLTWLLPMIVALIMVASSCGNKAGKDNSGEEVRIGILLPQTGAWAWIGPAANGVRFAADQINTEGGIQTRDGKKYKIKLYSEDSGTESRMAISGARKLYSINNVIALIGPTSATIRSVIPLTNEVGAVQVSPTAGTTALDARGGGKDDEWVFRSVSSDVTMGSGMVGYARDVLGAQRAACFFSDDEGARSIYGVVKDACSVANIEIVSEVFFPMGQTSYRAELGKVAGTHPDVIFFEAGPETAGIFFKQWYELDYEGTWVGTDFVNQTFVNATWPASKGVIGINPGPLPGPRYEKWLSDYEQFKNQRGLDPFALNAYDALVIIALALEHSGEISSDAVKESIYEVTGPPGEEVHSFADGARLLRQGKDIDFSGMAGPMDFNEFGDPITYLKVEVAEEKMLKRIGTLTEENIGDIINQVLAIRKAR